MKPAKKEGYRVSVSRFINILAVQLCLSERARRQIERRSVNEHMNTLLGIFSVLAAESFRQRCARVTLIRKIAIETVSPSPFDTLPNIISLDFSPKLLSNLVGCDVIPFVQLLLLVVHGVASGSCAIDSPFCFASPAKVRSG